jgi:hypothetical protein
MATPVGHRRILRLTAGVPAPREGERTAARMSKASPRLHWWVMTNALLGAGLVAIVR